MKEFLKSAMAHAQAAPVGDAPDASGRAQDSPAGQAAIAPPVRERFRLLRHFSLASFIALVLFAAAWLYFEHLKNDFSEQVQQEQNAFFAQLQEGFVRRHDPASSAYLLKVYETGNINLGRLFSNAMWEKDFAPLVAKAQRISVDQCRAIAELRDEGGKAVQPGGMQACFAGIGRQIVALPEFRSLNARVYDTIKNSTVFKIKVYDLRGITVYSSEHSQVGEDQTGNAGWVSAAAGKPASALTHRDQFRAFEGVVVNRDMVSTYLPVLAPGSENIVGVFEVYSDVTPFLQQISSTSSEIRKLIAANHMQLERAAAANREKLAANVKGLLPAMFGTFALLYLALFLIVRNAQSIIDEQDLGRRRAEVALARQKDLYDALSRTNGAIVRLSGAGELFQTVCRIAVEHGRFRFTWIGMIDKDDHELRPVAYYGDDAGYMKHLDVPGDSAGASRRGLTGRALLSGRYVVSNDFLHDWRTAPWHEPARRAGVHASAKFPIRQGGTVVGAINFYAGETGFFTEDLVATLEEMARDVSFGLDNFQREAERTRAVEALRESHARTELLVESSNIGLWDWNLLTDEVFFSPQWKQHLGHTEHELPNRYEEWENRLHPEDRERTLRAVMDFRDGRRADYDIEFRMLHKDGSWRWIMTRANLVRDAAGQPVRMMGAQIDITESKRAEQALRDSERLLRESQAIAGLGSYVLDIPMDSWRSSAVLDDIFGIDDNYERSVAGWLSLIHPEWQEQMSHYLADEVLGKHIRFDREYQINRKTDGEARWVHGLGELEFDAQGRPCRMIGTISDITWRRKADEALRQSEGELRAIFEGALDGILVADAEAGTFLTANREICLMLGYTLEEILRIGVSDIHPQQDLPRVMEGFERQRRGEIALTADVPMMRKDGSVFLADIKATPIRLGDKDALLGVFRDVTGRKLSERALRAAEEQFRGLVEQSIAGTYIIQDGKLAYVNPRCAEILGQGSADELIGSDPLLLIAEADRGKVAGNMRRLLEGDAQSVELDFGVPRRDGVAIQVGINGARATHQGRPAIIGLLQDISEKKRAEEQIQRYVAQLEKAFMSTVGVATTLSEMRDPYTAGHERRVAEIAVAIGAELGFDGRRQEGLRVAGYLHDIGKITIPSEILSKPGKLSPIEFKLIQGHAQASYDVLKDVEFPWPVAEVALQHHERIDGSGYPQGLKGEAILHEARIMAVADVVEAMSSHRPYRAGLGIEAALAEVERGRGTAYGPEVADACLKLFREKGYVIPA